MGKRKWKSEVNELSDGRKSVDDHTVYLGRLPDALTSKQQVVEALQEFGEAVHVHIKDLSHGFVHFASVASAEAAIRAGSVEICYRSVDIRKAVDKDDGGDGTKDGIDGLLQEGEECFYWQGRLEKFRRGHGFLRPLPGGEQLPDTDAEGIHRGVYVSFAQVERFQLQDADVVGAEVRPPRSKAQRFSGEFQGTQDENSWALIRVCDVNGEDSSKRDRGWAVKIDIPPTFEWTGIVECWRKSNHGFLRPLAKEDRRSISNPEIEEAEMGVFINPGTIENYNLRDGDVVKALICNTPQGKSMIVKKVLHLERASEECIRSWSFALEGLIETFSEKVGGYGFLRPAEDSRELFREKGCGEGVYISAAQIRRYHLYDGQRVVGLIYPAQPPERSPRLADIMPDKEGDDVWQLLEKKDLQEHEEEEDHPPQRIRNLLGIRMHGRITRVSLGKYGYYGFLKADHIDIWEQVFFRVETKRVEPRTGESVFFRLEIRRRGCGDWTPCAVNLHFHEQGMAPPKEHEQLVHVANAWLDTLDIPPEKLVEMDEPLTTMAKDAMDTGEAERPEEPAELEEPEAELAEGVPDIPEVPDVPEPPKPPEPVPEPRDPPKVSKAPRSEREERVLPGLDAPPPVPPSSAPKAPRPPSQSKARQAKGEGKGTKGSKGTNTSSLGTPSVSARAKRNSEVENASNASNASKIRITVHVNGQQLPGHLPSNFLPRGSVAQQIGPQTGVVSSAQMAAQSQSPKQRIRPTMSPTSSTPSALPNFQGKKKKNKRHKNDKNDKNKKGKEGNFDHGNHSKEITQPASTEARPRIAPSHAPEHSQTKLKQPKVTKVLQSTPKILPRPPPRATARDTRDDKDDFIIVQVNRHDDTTTTPRFRGARRTTLPTPPAASASSASDFVVVQLDADADADDQPNRPSKVAKMDMKAEIKEEIGHEKYAKDEIKEEFDDDW